MGKQIIVAGAGVGGLATAALLAKAGYAVTVYERKQLQDLGDDWTDTLSLNAFRIAGVKLAPDCKYRYLENQTVFSPDLNTTIIRAVPRDQVEARMSRRELYRMLITGAQQNDVAFVCGCEIHGPLLLGNRVVGLETEKGTVYGDLVIDSAGLFSPVRSQLPEMCTVDTQIEPSQLMYALRACYPVEEQAQGRAVNSIYPMPNGEPGIATVTYDQDCAELSIVRFQEFCPEDVDSTLHYLHAQHPAIGTTPLRVSEVERFSAREPMASMVCDGYAAIGASAFMSSPLSGDGVTNSLKAARILSNIILADKTTALCADTLWEYELTYMKKAGISLATILCILQMFNKLTPDELNSVFEQNIVSAEDFVIGASSAGLTSLLKVSSSGLKGRLEGISHDRGQLRKILPLTLQIGKLSAIASLMPKRWNKANIQSWTKRYQNIFLP